MKSQKNPVHIVLNSDESLPYERFSEQLDNLKIPYFEVRDIGQFNLIVKNLPLSTLIYVWIHPNLTKAAKTGKTTSEILSTLPLKKEYPNLKFNYLTRQKSSIGNFPISIEKDKVFEPFEIYEFMENNSPQSIGEILGADIDNSLNDSINGTKTLQKLPSDYEKIDYAIITSQYYDEFEEIKYAFNIKSNAKIMIGSHIGYKFDFANKTILAVSQSRIGMVDAGILTTQIICKYNPTYILMPGVCGGDTKTSFGDLIISNNVILFQSGKLTPKGIEKEALSCKIDDTIVNKIIHDAEYIQRKKTKGIMQDIKTNHINSDRVNEFAKFNIQSVKVHVKPTACSFLIINKEGYFQKVIKAIDRNMIAVEMEGFGMGRSAELVNNQSSKVLLIKGVMDKTRKKSDLAKRWASYLSSQFIKELIKRDTLYQE